MRRRCCAQEGGKGAGHRSIHNVSALWWRPQEQQRHRGSDLSCEPRASSTMRPLVPAPRPAPTEADAAPACQTKSKSIAVCSTQSRRTSMVRCSAPRVRTSEGWGLSTWHAAGAAGAAGRSWAQQADVLALLAHRQHRPIPSACRPKRPWAAALVHGPPPRATNTPLPARPLHLPRTTGWACLVASRALTVRAKRFTASAALVVEGSAGSRSKICGQVGEQASGRAVGAGWVGAGRWAGMRAGRWHSVKEPGPDKL